LDEIFGGTTATGSFAMSSVQAAAVTLENRYVQGDNDTPRSSFESYATDVSVDNVARNSSMSSSPSSSPRSNSRFTLGAQEEDVIAEVTKSNSRPTKRRKKDETLDAILEAVKRRASVTSPPVTSQLSKVQQAITLFSQRHKANFNLEQRVAIKIYITDHPQYAEMLLQMDEDEQSFYLQQLL
jgi:hypothetical protein